MSRPRVADVRADIAAQHMEVTSAMLSAAVQTSAASKLQAIALDRKLYAVPLHVWESIIAYNRIDTRTYEAERFDCDDFALAFKGVVARDFRIGGAVGLVVDLSGRHAYNALLVCQRRDDMTAVHLSFLEPQTDRILERPGRAGTMYDMESGWILF